MNIRSTARPITALDLIRPAEVYDRFRLDPSVDRDPQNPGRQAEDHPSPPTPEEIEKAMLFLEQLPVIQDHQLEVRLEGHQDRKFVIIQEPSGSVVRRIPIVEVVALVQDKKKRTGQLLDKKT